MVQSCDKIGGMEAIGGYPALELRQGEHYHTGALKLNTARNALEYILRVRGYDKVYIPYYTCDAVTEPFKKLGLPYEFYHIDRFFQPESEINIKRGEAVIYTNYFGLKGDYCHRLAEKYGTSLVIDNSQAFYEKPIDGIDTIYSPRKFFGVSDGGYLYTDCRTLEIKSKDRSYSRMGYLLKRIDESAEAGYSDFQRSEEDLSQAPIRWMSDITSAILCSIDYEAIKKIRRENYNYLSRNLDTDNGLHPVLSDEAVPLAYPYLTSDRSLRNHLISHKVYVPKYWLNVADWSSSESLEYLLAECLLPLPVGQTYGEYDLNRIIQLITI